MTRPMVRQLVVFVENRTGSLAELAAVFAEAEVNVRGLLLEGAIDFGHARVHVDNLRAAEKALQDAGYQYEVGDALVVRLANKPGALADAARKLAAEKLNVESVFGTTTEDGHAEFVFMVDDAERAKKVLGLA